MKHYRVTKYNPINRDQNGRYIKDEWISVGEIGRIYDGVVLTNNEYLRVEQLYVNAIIEIMNCNDISRLKIGYLERYGKANQILKPNKNMKRLYRRVRNDCYIDIYDIPDYAKMNLRAILWCRLENTEKMYVHFGYDYYMYIGSGIECENSIEKIRSSGLFVEAYTSPYLTK